jgi:ribose transport system substrate-binding protein
LDPEEQMPAWRMAGVLMFACAAQVQAGGHTFAIIGKSADTNFLAAGRGCAEAAERNGDTCVLLASTGPAHPRLQERVVADALKSRRYDALAISVTRSDMIARALHGATIPVTTFDSPFAAPEQASARSYLGVDNVLAGRELGHIARQLKPAGGTICLMTSAHDANLAQRVAGARQALSGNPAFPRDARLKGEGGWTETARCPWNSNDTVERTMAELETTLAAIRPDVFLSVGHWPLADIAAYRKTVQPYRDQLAARRIIMIAASGAMDPDRVSLMQEKLIHGYISIDFVQLGKLCYEEMEDAVSGRPARVLPPMPVSVIIDVPR